MKILFFDIDGVLNDHSKHRYSEYCGIKPECMELFNRIIGATNCKLVLISAWRYMILNNEMTLRGFEYMLNTHGLLYSPGVLIGHTCADEVWDSREAQIQDWRNVNSNPVNFAIVDDLNLDFSYNKVYKGKFIQTDGNQGLTLKNAADIIKVLQ